MYNTNAYLATFSFLSAVELLPQTTDTTELLKPISQSSETSFYIFLLTAVERPSGTPDWEAVTSSSQGLWVSQGLIKELGENGVGDWQTDWLVPHLLWRWRFTGQCTFLHPPINTRCGCISGGCDVHLGRNLRADTGHAWEIMSLCCTHRPNPDKMDGSNWKSVFQSLRSCWQKPTGVELNVFYYYAVIITNFSSSTTRSEVRCKRVSPKAPHQWGCQLASTEKLSLHIKLHKAVTALQNCIGSCFYLMSRADTNWEKCFKIMYKEYSHMDCEGINQISIKWWNYYIYFFFFKNHLLQQRKFAFSLNMWKL